MDRFVGKAVLVTGAASGIGAATAARLVGEGAAVVGADLVEPASPDLGSNGGSFTGLVADVRDDDAVAAAVAAAA
ncbi:MAG: putative short chain dehydrogenase, partial [Acidimicrobiales bacterium]|nr:putative short chain dehydrogenase [Acidimicrobiales bacterium]